MVTAIDPGSPPEPGTRSGGGADIGFVPRPRIRWFSPGLLVRTGIQVAVSSKFAEFIDQRESQAVAPGTCTDLSAADELWIDYVSDCGDGFDAATTVASVIARDELDLGPVTTRAGSVLVMGGDQAYPYASMREYRDRLVGPYRSMLPWTAQPRRLLAIPGNHDWYDGLSSFRKQFCQGRWIGGWKTEQTRSYFAVTLPGPWRLWAIDIALGTDIDGEQLDWFRARAAELHDGDAIILCSAKPSWTDAGADNPEAHAALDYFERTVIGKRARLRVSLTGDSHHYARYQGPDGQQKITAGGGGAYLGATHHLPPSITLPPPTSLEAAGTEPVRFELATTYPSTSESRGLRAAIASKAFRNGLLWLLLAALYLLGAMPAARILLGTATVLPVLATAAVFGALLAALVGFARLGSAPRSRTAVLGAAHASAHAGVLAGAILLSTLLDLAAPWREAAALGAAAFAGALFGPLVVAVYLRLADALGVNSNELFSAMGLEGHKNFIRLHIEPGGHRLTIYPVKIARCARWTFDGTGTDGTRRWFAPDVEPEARLIEYPVVVSP